MSRSTPVLTGFPDSSKMGTLVRLVKDVALRQQQPEVAGDPKSCTSSMMTAQAAAAASFTSPGPPSSLDHDVMIVSSGLDLFMLEVAGTSIGRITDITGSTQTDELASPFPIGIAPVPSAQCHRQPRKMANAGGDEGTPVLR